MPDSSGILTPEEKEKAKKWLTDNWKNWACPFSGHTNWELGEVVVQAVPFIGGGIMVGGPVYPMLALVCGGCGNTVFINAIKAGIVIRKEDKDVKRQSS